MKGTLLVLVAGMLVSGSVNTISKKLGYGTCSTSPVAGDYSTAASCGGFSPNGHQFRKPWSFSLVMFTGEALCLMLFFYRRARAARRTKQRDDSLLQGAAAYSPYAIENDPGKGPGGSSNQMRSPAYNFLSPTMARVKNGPGAAAGADLHDPDVIDADAAYANVTLGSSLYCLLPACCDLGGTTVSGIGLLFVTASVFQMLRGSIIFFTAIFSVIFLKRKLYAFHWVGMGMTVVGVTAIGLSSILGAKDAAASAGSGGGAYSPAPAADDALFFFHGAGALLSPNGGSTGPAPGPSPSPSAAAAGSAGKQLLGVILVVVSQLMSATQMVVEEKFLKSKKLPPEFVVGCEGSFGVIMMLCIALPVVAHVQGVDGGGMHESAIDAAYLFANSGPLMAMVLSYFISIAFYNFCGLAVAKRLSSVHRCLIDACRTILVWTIDLLLHSISGGKYGESWKPTASWVQLAGFVVLVFGSCLYYKVLRLKCFEAGYRADEGLSGDDDDDYPVAAISSQHPYNSFSNDAPFDSHYGGDGQRRISYGDEGFDRMHNNNSYN